MSLIDHISLSSNSDMAEEPSVPTDGCRDIPGPNIPATPTVLGSAVVDMPITPRADSIRQQAAVGSRSPAQATEPEQQPETGPETRQGLDSEPEPDCGKEKPPADPPQRGWKPKWLRRRVFAAFATCFFVLLGAIEVLATFSNRNQGISSEPQPNFVYLWTFGPSASTSLPIPREVKKKK